ncbi:MAG: PAS domain S-box protein [Bacteroidales bacterium]|nr:PAS domain S-box protein [Bacteroidales bacterium]
MAQKKKVLVLHSYHQGLSWTDNITKGIQSVLGIHQDIEVHFEYLDSKRNVDSLYFKELYQLYRTKHHNIPFEAILVSDNNALYFVQEHRNEFFKDIPIVFCAIDQFSDSLIKGMDKITGVTEHIDFKRNIELILQLHPFISEIVIINDNQTVSARINKKFIQDFWPDLNTKVTYRFFEDLRIPELLEQVNQLTASSVILLTNFTRDRKGKYISYQENIEMIRKVTSIPVYSGWEFYLDRGIVGGMLTSGYDQGRIAAELVMSIINGTDPDQLPIVREGYNHLEFDYRQLIKYNISLNLLPQGSLIINKPPGFFTRYKYLLYISAGFILLMALLLVNNEMRNRRKASRLVAMNRELDQRVYEKTTALREANTVLKQQKQQIIVQNNELDKHRHNLIDLVKERTNELEHANRKLENGRHRLMMMLDVSSDGVWEYNIKEGTFMFSSQTWERLGYNKKDIAENVEFIDSLIHSDDVKVVQQSRRNYIEQKISVYVCEFRIISRTGNWIWLLSRGKILEWDQDGNPRMLVGTHIDITERKKAEQKLLQEEKRLRDSEKRWRSLFEQAGEGIIIMSLVGDIIEVNPEAAISLQYNKNELLSMNILDVDVEKEDHKNAREFLAKKKLSNDSFSYETIIKRKDKSTFPAEVSLNQIDYSGSRHWLVTFRDISKRQEFERHVLNAIIQTEENERSRFSRDLHDTIGPLLSGMKLYLSTLEKTKSEERKKKVFSLSNEAINEAIASIREISNNLSPQTLTDYGLVSALKGFIQRLNASHLINASLNTIDWNQRIDQEKELALYRITTELINNTLKHSEATKIDILLEHKKRNITITYRDNGKGMKDLHLKSKSTGMGLSNIQSRLKSVDGKIFMSHEEDWRFIAQIIVPIKKLT